MDNKKNFRGYIFNSDDTLSDEEANSFCEILSKERGEKNLGVLGGRSFFIRYSSDKFGDVVIKRYRRGGMWSKLISSTYLYSRKTRADIEREVLNRCRSLGIAVPRPCFTIAKYRFGYFYSSWLIMEDLGDHSTLAHISITSPKLAVQYFEQLRDMMNLLIENSIYHVDLHPGNVIISNDKLTIIDFDKGIIDRFPKEKLKEWYLRRWRRAVIKHQLPEFLSEQMCYILRSK